MNNIKILIGLTVLAIYGLTLSHSLHCYSCNSKESCKNATQYNCNTAMANTTRSYLYTFHMNVNISAMSPNFDCFEEHITYSSGERYYKGCIYSNTRGCQLQLRPEWAGGKRDCRQCNNKNGCNPAGRAELHYGLSIIVLTIAVLGKFVWFS